MGRFLTRPEWLAAVREQEEKLRYPTFSREDAWRLGQRLVEKARAFAPRGAALAILEDDMTVFSCKLPGSGLDNECWMRRKLNAARAAGCSSLQACLLLENGSLPPDWARDETRAACGGCFPLRLTDGTLWGWLLCSGLEHYDDHGVLAGALACDLGLTVPRISP